MTKMHELITKLSIEASPKKVLARPIKWTFALLLMLVFYAAIVQIFFGIRGDFAAQLTRPLFVAEVVLMLLLLVYS